MTVPARESERPAGAPSRESPVRPATRGPLARAAIELQRAAGNRSAGRVLRRWTRHPDQEKKGVMVPDVVAAEHDRFNPPKNE